jgi:glycosyltransferase involved in cell wall biosynthesis
VQARIAKIYRRDSVVISPPVSLERFSLSEHSDDYFLTVGRMVAYKRGDIVIEGCKQAGVKLKVVGGGPEEPMLRKLAEGAPHIEFTGRVSDEELQKLYAGAKGFIFASEEDAGIVPVEAMACGKPVIAYGKGGVTDVVRDGVDGLYFAEQSVTSLVKALQRFESMQFDPHTIRAQAERFSKAAFQEKITALMTALQSEKAK